MPTTAAALKWLAVLGAISSCCAGAIPPGARVIPFSIARTAVHRLSLRSEGEWVEWVEDNKLGITSRYEWLMPNEPDLVYAEWKSWDDWLGVPLSYEDARAEVQKLGIESQELWWAFSREEATRLQDLRVPSRPHLYYSTEWQGYDHWLSREEQQLVLPRNWPGATDSTEE